MSTMGYDINKLDEAFMDPQADYLAFINQILSPKGDSNIGEASQTTSLEYKATISKPDNPQDVSSAHRWGVPLAVAAVTIAFSRQ